MGIQTTQNSTIMAKKKSNKKDNKKKDGKKKDGKKKDGKKKILKLKLRKKKDSKKKDSKKKDSKKKESKKKDSKKKDSKKKAKAKPEVVQVARKNKIPPAIVVSRSAPKTSPKASPKAPPKAPPKAAAKNPVIKNVDHSSNYNVQEAVKKLKAIKSTEELLAFTNGEKRLTITRAISLVKAKLGK